MSNGKLSENALKVAENRYFMDGEDWESCVKRVGSVVAIAENSKALEYTDKFSDMLYNMYFLPGGRIMRNAGRQRGSMYNCYVVPIGDSREEIGQFYKDTLILWGEGGGIGCVRKDAYVITLGGIKKVQEVVIGDYVASYNSFSSDVEYRMVSDTHKFVVKNADNIKIDINCGGSVLLSNWHPTAVFVDGEVVYKRADELTTNDWIVTGSNLNISGVSLDKDLCWMIGAYLGDGSAYLEKNNHEFVYDYENRGLDRHRYRLKFYTSSLDVSNHFTESINRLFNTHLNVVTEGKLYGCSTNKYSVVDFLDCCDMQVGKKSYGLFIPDMVLKANLNSIFAFLAGFLDTDGYIDEKKNKVIFTSVSKNILEQIQFIISSVGGWARLRCRHDKDRVSTSGVKSTVDMYELGVKLPDDLLVLLASYMRHVDKKKYVERFDSFSYNKSVPEFIYKEFYKYRDLLSYKDDSNLYDFIYRFDKFKTRKSRILFGLMETIIDRVSDIREKTYLKYLYKICHNIQPIKSINSNIKDTDEFYDLTVDHNNNYFAGFGAPILIHNTNISSLRPKGAPIKGVGGYSSGPVSFLKASDAIAETIESGGSRRSAALALMSVTHPDIIDFIDAKLVDGELSHFNISVGITDEFLAAVESNKEWEFKFSHQLYGKVDARDIWDKIVNNMVVHAEPGIINLTNLLKNNSYYFEQIQCVNPCGEVPLGPYACCNLGSLVLPNFITGNINTNWKKMEEVIELAVRFLDDVIEVNKYVLKEIDISAHNSRRIGIGIMGLAEYLFAKKLKYGSSKSIYEIERLMRFIRDKVYESSIKIAIEKGAFPKFDPVQYGKASFVRKLPASLRMDIKKNGIRNVTLQAIAPTGTISLLADVTSGIEPLFRKAYLRHDRVGDRMYVHHIYKDALLNGCKTEEWFVDTDDLKPEDHFEMQAIVQKYVDGAVSKTINMPKGTKSDELSRLMLEYVHDLKGVTIYVDESREGQILNKTSEKEVQKFIKENKTVDSMLEDSVRCSTGTCEI